MNRRNFLGSGLAFTALLWTGCGSSFSASTNPSSLGTSASFPVEETLLDGLVTFNADGTRFLLNFYEHSVSRLGPSGEVVWTVGGLGTGDGIFNFPAALESDGAGRLYVADRGNGEVDVLDEDGNSLQTIGRGQMSVARDLTLGLDRQEIYVCDSPEHNLKVFGFDGQFRRTIGSFGDAGSGLNYPTGVDFDQARDQIHVTNYGYGQILVFTGEGNFVRSYGGFGQGFGLLQYPESVVVLPDGGSLVADSVAGFVTQFDSSGKVVDQFRPTSENGSPLNPEYLSLGPDNLLVVGGTVAFSPNNQN